MASRKWTLRANNRNQHHGVVSLSESPLCLELSWRPSSTDPVSLVGVFKLDLNNLLKSGYIRHDPVGSNGSKVRLRIARDNSDQFYVQANNGGPRFLLDSKSTTFPL